MRPKKASAAASPATTIDDAIEDCVLTRRDFYLGLWAGRKLGLSDGALQDYARSVVAVDYEDPGSEALIQKLQRDFVDHGCAVGREEIERELHRLEADAHQQFMVSD
jgi:hypothetical protein